MSRSVEISARSVDEAVELALEELDASIDDVVIEVLEEAEGGILGIGRRPARVRVSVDDYEADASADAADFPDDFYAADDEDGEDDWDYEDDAGDSREAGGDDELTLLAGDFVRSVVRAMDVDGEVTSWRDGEHLRVEVNGSDVGAVIGRRGDTLNALQYLTSLTVNRACEGHIYVTVDVAGYRARRERSLIDLAERTAGRVLEVGKEYVMEPMTAAERRIIHTALQDWPGIRTESEGEEPNRSVIIIPTDY
ncbi:MAG: RNA-binding cell elongation regulator Jag/EloR [Bacillota bacterium]|nr:RNA-binding cell elongation regulator Jag/EloR [Bacillota bacterium]